MQELRLCEEDLTVSLCHICGKPAVSIQTIRANNRQIIMGLCIHHKNDRQAQHEYAESFEVGPLTVKVFPPVNMPLNEALKQCATIKPLQHKKRASRSVKGKKWLPLFSDEWREAIRRARGGR